MADPLLVARDLRRAYPRRRAGLDPIVALDGVGLEVRAGEALGVVGESGAGKSTLTRLLLALERPDSGEVLFDGHPISSLPERSIRPLRRRFSAVFQDPLGSLNPRMRVGSIVAEPLIAFQIGSAAERRRRAARLLEAVGLEAGAAQRFPGAFSGGERQRIAIARALATEPELLVLDEPVSALDVVTQRQILDLVAALREGRPLALVLVAHDLGLVARVCDRVMVLRRGRILESGPASDVLARPSHPYTRDLLAASPAALLVER